MEATAEAMVAQVEHLAATVVEMAVLEPMPVVGMAAAWATAAAMAAMAATGATADGTSTEEDQCIRHR